MPQASLLDGAAPLPHPPPVEMNNVNIFDALEGAYANQQNGDDNPFEPVPLPDMEPESLFQ